MHTVSFAINYWSRGQVQGLFLRHEGYLGAIGAFLKGAEECGKLLLGNRAVGISQHQCHARL